MKRIAILTSCTLMSAIASAQTSVNDSISNDSISPCQLQEVVVEARYDKLGTEVSTYIPTAKQKNSAQTAADLLNRMAIPQLKISPNDEIKDLAGKNVESILESKYYDKIEQAYSTNDLAFARLAVTYTFGFGKKVERGDEASQLSVVNSGILK